MSAAQISAFQASGLSASTVAAVLLGFVFTVVLLWGVWAIHAAYVGWAARQLSERQLLGVVLRFVAIYAVLTFLLLS